MTWNLVCDSSCDLHSGVLDGGRVSLEVVPLRITVGEREWLDDETLNTGVLLEAMQEEKSASSTACPSPAAFARAFEKADCSLCFTISSNLSGTYNAAVLGQGLVQEEHPEKKVCVIDSRSTAGAMVLLVRRAKELIEAEENPDFEEICGQLRVYQAALRTIFTLENYDNLIKNGRMRPLVGNLLHALGIHVIAEGTPQGTINVIGKARGEEKTFHSIVTSMGKNKDCTDAEVVICHCENLPGALRLKRLISETLPVRDVTVLPCRGLTSFYAMKSGLIIVF